jgi:hypothetical protein
MGREKMGLGSVMAPGQGFLQAIIRPKQNSWNSRPLNRVPEPITRFPLSSLRPTTPYRWRVHSFSAGPTSPTTSLIEGETMANVALFVEGAHNSLKRALLLFVHSKSPSAPARTFRCLRAGAGAQNPSKLARLELGLPLHWPRDPARPTHLVQLHSPARTNRRNLRELTGMGTPGNLPIHLPPPGFAPPAPFRAHLRETCAS